ncbi:MAG TPA: dipeptidase [Trueperaceae bacterium]|nr:dipeptidase [Trueperaceae bacterium]
MIPVFDGHNDTVLLHLEKPDRDFFERHDDGHLDLPRAREGGMIGGFFAVFPPGHPQPGLESGYTKADGTKVSLAVGSLDPTSAVADTNRMVAQLLRWDADEQGRFRLVRTVSDIEQCIERGVMAGIMHFEGAEAIGPDLAALDVYYAAGLRSLGIVWSRPNLFGNGVPFLYPSSPDVGPGLTGYGLRLVRRCNELGIMVDLSHITERGFWDVAATSTAPLVATHSNAHAICASTRNLTDEQLDAVAASQGVVGVNYNVSFLAPDGSRDANLPLAVMVRHVDHLVDRLGIDGVALGSDFDGATMPTDLSDVSKLPNLMNALADAGYGTQDLEKIGYRNWLRVLRLTWGA